MAQNIFLKADEMGKEIRDKREADQVKKEQDDKAQAEVKDEAKQHEEDERQGMI
jgi:hypothetical protein